MLSKEKEPVRALNQSQKTFGLKSFEYLRINLHVVSGGEVIITGQSFDRNIFLHILLADDPLVQVSSRTALEAVVALLLWAVVGSHVVAEQLSGLVLLNNADIDIATRAQVVEDTGLDRFGTDVDGALAVKVRLPGRLEHGHRCQRSRSHGHVRKLVCRTVCVHSVQSSAGRVNTSHHEVRSDVALVAEEVLLEHGHAGNDTGVTAC